MLASDHVTIIFYKSQHICRHARIAFEDCQLAKPSSFIKCDKFKFLNKLYSPASDMFYPCWVIIPVITAARTLLWCTRTNHNGKINSLSHGHWQEQRAWPWG